MLLDPERKTERKKNIFEVKTVGKNSNKLDRFLSNKFLKGYTTPCSPSK